LLRLKQTLLFGNFASRARRRRGFMGAPSTHREVPVKATYICAVAAALYVSPQAFAADGDAKPTQQTRFAACAHESKGLRGDEHQKFMSECLKSGDGEAKKDAVVKTSSGEPGSQQNRMKSCNDEARTKDLHGDERRAFMSACLKG
jgi:psiF repeat-containing protein